MGSAKENAENGVNWQFNTDGKAIAIPVEKFHERVGTVEKDEKVSDEPIERLSHVNGCGTKGDTSVGRNGQHEAMTASNSPRERGWLSRTMKPLGVMISTEAGFGSARVSGTKVGGAVSAFHCRCFLSQL